MNLKDECVYYLKRIVKKRVINTKKEMDWFTQMDKHKCIFVHIPKTAGISVSVSLLGKSIGNMSALYDQVLFGKKDFASYFKFSFVRNPFTRLISAYEYLKTGGGGASDVTNCQAVIHSTSLEDFVLNYLTPSTTKSNRYFRSQHQFVCDSANKILIDYVGRFETIDENYEFIRHKIRVGKPLQKLNITHTQKQSVKEYYANEAVVNKVISTYKKDFELFGYSKNISDIQ